MRSLVSASHLITELTRYGADPAPTGTTEITSRHKSLAVGVVLEFVRAGRDVRTFRARRDVWPSADDI